MGIKELIKNTPHSEIIKEIIELYSERIEENKISHVNSYSKEIALLDRIITQYFFMSNSVRDYNDVDKLPARFYVGKHYINTIANNFYNIKELFINGFHIQLQLLLRNQFEYVNNLIAFTGDDEFFKRFVLNDGIDSDLILTPKPTHAKKSIMKLLNKYDSQHFKEFWVIFEEMMNLMYSDLSESAHGNILRVAVQSQGQHEDGDEYLEPNSCGVKNPLPVTMKILKESLNYFQITYRIVWLQLENKDMFDKDSPFLDFVNYYNNKIDLLRDE